MSEQIYVKLSKKEVDEILTRLKELIYEYNKNLRGTGFYLRPMHIVYKGKSKKYIYIGKYWYYLEYKKKKLIWNYVGTMKPVSNLPDPPEIPEVTIIKRDGEYYITQLDLERLKAFLQRVQIS